MTKEEAIAMLENDKRINHDFLSGKYRQALNMAINALSVDLVRCGECKYQESCSELGEKIEADDYCSFGERENSD